jgi:hypothetical protein
MKNERRLMPLRKYEVTFDNMDEPLTFTADDMDFDVPSSSYRFLNAGNIIRVIAAIGVEQIVVTPIDEA